MFLVQKRCKDEGVPFWVAEAEGAQIKAEFDVFMGRCVPRSPLDNA